MHASWKRYLNDLTGRCKALQGRLEQAGNDHYKNDDATKAAFDGLNDRYKDTSAVGGHGRGR